ncbi:MAG: class I SAM-dependent methyltransferase [Maribacter sp.]|nr:class I SAM-dependent methyltransferase [Maribacter sp.]
MSELYGRDLSKVFDKMYQGFIDYDEEYQFYASLCRSKNAQSIIEICCGSGNLARKFRKTFRDYLGLDYSQHMLDLARQKNPNGQFIQADMRDFQLDRTFDAALITGRSINYLVTDDDVMNTFRCIYNILGEKGHLIFDCIDADRFLPYIKDHPIVTHSSLVEGIRYRRTSNWHLKEDGKTIVDWSADYFKEEAMGSVLLGKDSAFFRVFTDSEITSFLNETGFKVLDSFNRPSYAFDTFVMVAQKMEKSV